MYNTIIDAATLQANLDNPAWAIVDCRFDLLNVEAGRQAYLQGHIPGAKYADLNRDLSATISASSGRHPLPGINAFARKLGQWGITPDTQVVVYDDINNAIAVRLWWMLRFWWRHANVAVLDGGLQQWTARGFALQQSVPASAGGLYAKLPDAECFVDTEKLQLGLAARSHTVIDARSEERFNGEHEPIDTVAGHIPAAVNLPFMQNLDKTGCFLKPDVLAERFRLVLQPGKTIVHMCGSGVTACHNLLAMELSGLSGSILYPGSWSEWIRSSQRAVTKGKQTC